MGAKSTFKLTTFHLIAWLKAMLRNHITNIFIVSLMSQFKMRFRKQYIFFMRASVHTSTPFIIYSWFISS